MDPDAHARRIAARQDGVISVEQLRGAGLTHRQIHHRVRRGTLIRRHAGVLLIAGAPLTLRARVRAALLAAGPGAFASHRTAAVLWGIRRGDPEVIDITVPGNRRVRLHGVRMHRTKAGPALDTRTRSGIPLSSPGRTICELAATEPREQVEHAIQEAAANLGFTPHELESAAGRWGVRAGRTMLRSILQDETGGEFTRSWAEQRLAWIIRRAGLPPPETNRRLLGHRPDAIWRAQRLVVEVDGIGTHGTPVAFQADRAMDAELTAAGWRVLRFTARQLRDEPILVASQIARVLGAG
jgi:very-short-patch-repair endonuclease